MRKGLALLTICVVVLRTHGAGAAEDLKVGDPAPLFTATTSTGAVFDLASRKGQWTVLYFYPKAGTPGCTKQAQGFRDNIHVIHDAGAEVYGISTDTVKSQAAFAEEQHLSFTLLADPDGTVVSAYRAKMPLLTMARRWTFIIDPDLTIRQIERDVDPALDAQRVATEITRLKSPPAPGAPPSRAE
jgi:peroxiredoxin Q/BCP